MPYLVIIPRFTTMIFDICSSDCPLMQFDFGHSFRFETKSEAVIGDDILYLHPTSEYNVHFPIQRGEINLTPLVGEFKAREIKITFFRVNNAGQVTTAQRQDHTEHILMYNCGIPSLTVNNNAFQKLPNQFNGCSK